MWVVGPDIVVYNVSVVLGIYCLVLGPVLWKTDESKNVNLYDEFRHPRLI